jgi:hypothetical protein
VPLGMGLRLAGVRAGVAVPALVLVTVAIEALQFSVVPGRDSSLHDILGNAAGGALGVLVASRWRSLVRPTRGDARRLTAAAALAWCAILAATWWALRPDLDADRPAGGRVPHPVGVRPFDGELLEASLGDVELRTGPVDVERGGFGTRLTRGVPIRIALTPGTPTPAMAPILVVTSERGEELALLAQEGRDLVFRLRMRADALRLRTPVARLRDAFPPDSASLVTLAFLARLEGDALVVERTQGTAAGVGRATVGRLARSPLLGWSLLLPGGIARVVDHRLLSAMWLLAITFPVAYWARRWRRRAESERGGRG